MHDMVLSRGVSKHKNNVTTKQIGFYPILDTTSHVIASATNAFKESGGNPVRSSMQFLGESA
ncbi:hypothetical protein [Paraburkholderia mimosarum]|uniref:hypothetical protein n=1 Tax=Paraburkholderia mimosarum TaxID=312026 RepID=UPI000414CC05|nr:hypothetical protein [Paraburkholderia mimosarum]